MENKIGMIDLIQTKFIPVNVGFKGGDLPTRYFAGAVMATLTTLSAPPIGSTHSALKIAVLLAAMSGTILLMAGLVFSQKTHYAGIMLIPAPFLILWLTNWGLPWLAVIVGVMLIGFITQNVITRRCGINRLLGITSCPQPAVSG
jgi:hypothetical protein